jgi:RHH-type rel operon transcriptional repressor/antitoxin RelB
MLTLRLKPSVEQRLEDLARRTGRTKTFYAARAIEERLPEFEKAYQETVSLGRDPGKIREAIAALKDLRQGVTKPAGMTVREMIDSGRA